MRIKAFFILIFGFSVSVFGVKTTKIVILHTNDTHSQVEPVETSDLGGYARRLGVINQIRKKEKNVLLFDAGDFLQGTPYFNFYNGNVEAKALKMMKYDAITLGNHEFDNGMDSLAKVLKNTNLPIIVSNYYVENTPLKPYVRPYKIIKKGGVRVGVFGIGINLKGLAFQKNFEGLILLDPIQTAINTSDFLKNKLKCDLVICLSHLGVSSSDSSPTDYELAAQSKDIDIIIGGHSHKILVNRTVQNSVGKSVIIGQMGKKGENLGRIDLTFEKH
ncbi:MAG: bifunctional metallophosphatase/5'-nucleotidase [Bacteroidales bacterium]|nr:bifunctional metallophosphatase/5'-nucleotidase [Bacteroidales bacterium]